MNTTPNANATASEGPLSNEALAQVKGLIDARIPDLATYATKKEIAALETLPKGGDAGTVLTRDASGAASWKPAPQSGSWSADAQAKAQGFWTVVSATEPKEGLYKTADGTTVPIVWQKPLEKLVPVIPSEPVWDDIKGTVLVPSLVGVKYRVRDGIDIPGGEVTKIVSKVPSKVTIDAIALPGYKMVSTYSWTHPFPDPNAREIIASGDFATDSATIPFTLNNALGGTGKFIFSGEHGDRNAHEGYRPQGGVLTPLKPGTGNVWIFGRVAAQNLEVAFDVVSVGTTTSTAKNTPLASIAIRARSTVGDGGINLTFQKDTVVVHKSSVRIPWTGPDAQIGRWKLSYYDGVVSVTAPSGEVSQGKSDIDLKAQGESDGLQVRHYATASGFKIDNLVITKLGV
ncbi:hypothetical protein [Devriesea agamarum]|uniref:hypothetical protein n=1 Tax=Devriesea agamarum TaxID=472569 RepID=UPI00071E18EA|nr:hypothetical protein [Devriesea agamarum]